MLLVATGFFSFGLWAHYMFAMWPSANIMSSFSAASKVVAIHGSIILLPVLCNLSPFLSLRVCD